MFRKSIVIAAAFGFLSLGARGASAQSTDQSQPVVLTTAQIEGKCEPGGQSYFYTFTGGPGDVSVTINGTTEYSSSSLHVVFYDSKGRELANVPVTANSSGGKKVATVHLPTKQKVTMQIMFGVDVGAEVAYKVRLAGAVMLGDVPPTAVATRPAPPATIASADIGAGSTRELPVRMPVTVVQSPAADELPEVVRTVDNTPVEDKWALIVGVSKFNKDYINLKYPAKDAQDLYGFLTKEGNFAPDHVKLLVDDQATKERVMAEIGDKWLPRVARPNDLVLIYISSHGSPSQMDLEGLNYLVMHNTDPDSLYATGLSLQDFTTAIRNRVHARRVVVIIDACHSGAANTAKGIKRVGNFDGNALSQGTGQLVICSSEPNQVSWESTRYPNGVFTHQLIEALRAGSGKAKLGDAFERLKESVLAEVLNDRKEVQTPVMKSRWQGEDLILTAPPAKPRPAPSD